MEEGYIGSIMLWTHHKIPQGWMLCDGKKLNIRQNQALFALLGKKYGGDGINDFALPDLRGRTVVGGGANMTLGGMAGQETVPLTIAQLPGHTHTLKGMNSTSNPTAKIDIDVCLGSGDATKPMNLYNTDTQHLTALAPQSITNTGGGMAHNNMQPFLILNYIICVRGLFPPRD